MDKSWLEEFVWNVRFLFDLWDSQLICFIVEAEDRGLEYIANQLELLGSEQGLDFSLAIVVEPE